MFCDWNDGYFIMWQQGVYVVQGITYVLYLIIEYVVSILNTMRCELIQTAEMPYMTCIFYRVTYFVIDYVLFICWTWKYVHQALWFLYVTWGLCHVTVVSRLADRWKVLSCPWQKKKLVVFKVASLKIYDYSLFFSCLKEVNMQKDVKWRYPHLTWTSHLRDGCWHRHNWHNNLSLPFQ